ncbi:hypothetical protein GMLC_31890 [Geomonas limicola]|uniref:Response regulatory domain-containing protein n=1 Tax=Geomonas limicola TaxID=2740186 RepID=A0A6V8NAY4_9BACT|nr:response regulator [Geomonas limicola]GFO69610.1 hypothetical protein GMLC_31890 [Geomonas limicola]
METSEKRSVCFLVVEDDPETRTTISNVVARRFPEVTVRVAENGKVGLELCKEFRPALVITDINMPVMDGLRMIEEIRAVGEETRFIVMTGYSDRYHVENTSQLGISGFLVKPVDLRELFTASEKCLSELRQLDC